MKKILFAVFVLLFVGSSEVSAEVRNVDDVHYWYQDGPGTRENHFNNDMLSIGVPIGLAHNIGYAKPTLGIDFAATKRLSPRVAFSAGATFRPRAIKLGVGDGWNWSAGAGLNFYLSDRIFVGPTISFVDQHTSQWTKQAVYIGYTTGAHFGDPNGQRMTLSTGSSYDVKSFNHGVNLNATGHFVFPIGKKIIGDRAMTNKERRKYPEFTERSRFAVTKDTWGIIADVGFDALSYRHQCTSGAWGRRMGYTVDYRAAVYWNIW